MEYHAEFYSPQYFKFFEGFPRQKDGYVTLSDKPGLGLEINEKEIQKHPPFVNTNARGGANKTIWGDYYDWKYNNEKKQRG